MEKDILNIINFHKRLIRECVINRICEFEGINADEINIAQLEISLSADYYKSGYVQKMSVEDFINHVYDVGMYTSLCFLENDIKKFFNKNDGLTLINED